MFHIILLKGLILYFTHGPVYDQKIHTVLGLCFTVTPIVSAFYWLHRKGWLY